MGERRSGGETGGGTCVWAGKRQRDREGGREGERGTPPGKYSDRDLMGVWDTEV